MAILEDLSSISHHDLQNLLQELFTGPPGHGLRTRPFDSYLYLMLSPSVYVILLNVEGLYSLIGTKPDGLIGLTSLEIRTRR